VKVHHVMQALATELSAAVGCVESVEVTEASTMFDRMLETVSCSEAVSAFTQSVCGTH